eukprot:scaffold1190_cov393-Prasinococcus_capsulatus_cf.AAC.39
MQASALFAQRLMMSSAAITYSVSGECHNGEIIAEGKYENHKRRKVELVHEHENREARGYTHGGRAGIEGISQHSLKYHPCLYDSVNYDTEARLSQDLQQ